MKKPILYIQAHPLNKRRPLFDFCWSAKMGAESQGIKVKTFQNSSEIPGDPTNIVVGSIEMCSQWFEINGYIVPRQINLLLFKEFLGRNVSVMDIKDIEYPTFIKPFDKTKAFTGLEVDNQVYVDLFTENYKGLVWSQEIVDIVSEYRLYITNNKIIGMKHYTGDCLKFPDGKFIQKCVDKSKKLLDNHSYVLDFGVLSNNSTILIEPNDGWAIGNYGLESYDYYYFVRNRWFQITGIRKRME